MEKNLLTKVIEKIIKIKHAELNLYYLDDWCFDNETKLEVKELTKAPSLDSVTSLQKLDKVIEKYLDENKSTFDELEKAYNIEEYYNMPDLNEDISDHFFERLKGFFSEGCYYVSFWDMNEQGLVFTTQEDAVENAELLGPSMVYSIDKNDNFKEIACF